MRTQAPRGGGLCRGNIVSEAFASSMRRSCPRSRQQQERQLERMSLTFAVPCALAGFLAVVLVACSRSRYGVPGVASDRAGLEVVYDRGDCVDGMICFRDLPRLTAVSSVSYIQIEPSVQGGSHRAPCARGKPSARARASIGQASSLSRRRLARCDFGVAGSLRGRVMRTASCNVARLVSRRDALGAP
jgi:hypothetical protein